MTKVKRDESRRPSGPGDLGSPDSSVHTGNLVLVSMLVLGVAALWGLPFLQVAPNRLVSGQPLYFFSVLQGLALQIAEVVVSVLMALTLITRFTPSRPWLVAALALAAVSIPGLLWLAASLASASLQGQSPLARASFGSAFWVALILLSLIVGSALQQLRARALLAGAVWAALLLAVGVVLAIGKCGDLSLIKEYANRADIFVPTLARHVQIVLLAMAFTLLVGLPLAWLAYVRPALCGVLFPVLNIIQTVPSIALFGLLMVPLALLAASLPALARAGISGVGMAPAVIALTLYGLLPVVRNTLAGLQQVSSSTVSAALALGLSRLQVLRAIELPLALPIVLGGVRTAAVAMVGLATVSALIGAGGLGSIVFEGLFANAQDAVLLGVLPIIALGVLTDQLFKVLTAWARLKAQQK